MKEYSIRYSVGGRTFETLVDASSKVYARRKLARKHNVSERQIKLLDVSVIGYY